MVESYQQKIDAEQSKIARLKASNETPKEVRDELAKKEYMDAFFIRADKVQMDLLRLSLGEKDSHVLKFIEKSLGSIGEGLAEAAAMGLYAQGKRIEKGKVIPVDREWLESRGGKENVIPVVVSSLKQVPQFLQNIFSDTEAEVGRIIKVKDVELDLKKIAQRLTILEKNGQKSTIGQYEELHAALLDARKGLTPDNFSEATTTLFEEQEWAIGTLLARTLGKISTGKLGEGVEQYSAFLQKEVRLYLGEKIKNPKLIDETVAKIEAAITDKLAALKDARSKNEGVERAKAAYEDALDSELGKAPADFITMHAGGIMMDCLFDPPKSAEEYPKAKEAAQTTLETYVRHLREKHEEDLDFRKEESSTFINGILTVKVAGSSPDKIGRYKLLTVQRDEVKVDVSSAAFDENKRVFESFTSAFEDWKKSGSKNTSIAYGDPPRTFDLRPYLEKMNINRADLTLDIIRGKPTDEFIRFNGGEFLGSEGQIINYSYKYGRKKNGALYLKMRSQTDNDVTGIPGHFRSSWKEYGEEEELLKDGFTSKFVVNDTEYHTYTIVSDYYPRKRGEKMFQERKQLSKIDNGIVERTEHFNPDGNLIRAESLVEGSPGVVAVDYADGAVLEPDKEDKPGNIRHTMEFTDHEGNKVAIMSFPDMKKQNPSLTEPEYFKFLAVKLDNDELLHAFIETMFEYVHDSPEKSHPLKKGAANTLGDIWQGPSQTMNRVENGKMLGDCEDWAFFLQKLLEEQGKSAYVLGIYAHAEAVTLEKDSNGLYHAKSYGTSGVDNNGNRVGQPADPEKARGYTDIADALESINQKWIASLGYPTIRVIRSGVKPGSEEAEGAGGGTGTSAAYDQYVEILLVAPSEEDAKAQARKLSASNYEPEVKIATGGQADVPGYPNRYSFVIPLDKLRINEGK